MTNVRIIIYFVKEIGEYFSKAEKNALLQVEAERLNI